MIREKNFHCFIIFFCLLLLNELNARPFTKNIAPDVESYHVILDPNIQEGTIQGIVTIHFFTERNEKEVAFSCGDLIVDEVKGENIESFHKEGNQLVIKLSTRAGTEHEFKISYHGKPKRGINFFPAVPQVYTVFYTSEWMICNDQPDDRAAISLDLIVPDSLSVIANGVLKNKRLLSNNKMMYSFAESSSIPSYTFGFAVGFFNSSAEKSREVDFQYYSHNHTSEELDRIFKETAAMFSFFEDKSGVPFYGKHYSQILGQGWASQELSGFTVIRNSYGKQVLDDETQINLSAHEFAHQWWGNMVTCRDWNHFWLNEGLAVYMSSAFKEHRFGQKAYSEDIEAYYQAYKEVIDKGLDKPLVFESWETPTKEDRAIVYYKGAYVLHLLREELGDEAFWEGIKNYTQLNYGKSVVSKDFQLAMEESGNKDLDNFFNKWVYGSE